VEQRLPQYICPYVDIPDFGYDFAEFGGGGCIGASLQKNENNVLMDSDMFC
jgi:hypothetical protein